MSKRILTYNGIDLSTFKAHVSGEGAWVKPAPEYERISVPGRSGDVLLYNGRYSNVDITYRFGITKNFDTNYTNLIATLLASPGYHKLVDSKHPGVYRMAAVEKTIDPRMLPQLSAGEFEVTFNCKPQVYLDSGEEVASNWDSTVYTTNSIYNETKFDTRPLLKIATTGSQPEDFYVSLVTYKNGAYTGGATLEFKEMAPDTLHSPITYDAESGDAYDDSGKSLNDHLSATGDILIPAGNTLRAYVSGTSSRSQVSKIEIIPRWWRL